MTWILETLVASTLLIGAVLVLRRPAARLFGPHAAYLLWAVPALRLLLPPIPGAGVIDTPLAQAPAFAPSAAGLFEVSATPPATAALAPSYDLGLALVLLWAAGAAIHMAWHIVSYRRFIRRAVGAQAPARSMGGILVYNTDVAGPAAAGIVHRRILLPYDFADRFEPRERRLALAHEVAHHRRGDLVANWIGLAVLSLHWFNPLAHIAYRAFRADQELACDATVLREASEVERHAYASAVVKAAWTKSPVAACPMNSAGQLKARLATMKAGPIQRPLMGFLTVAVVAAAALGVTASRTAAALPGAPATPAALSALERVIDMAPEAFVAEPRSTRIDVPVTPVELEARSDATPTPADSSRGREVIAAPVLQLAVAQDYSEPLLVHPAEARTESLLPAALLMQAVTPPSGDDRRPDLQPVAATPASFAALPPPEVLKAHAVVARKELSILSRGVLGVSNVRAVMVDGRLNAAEPGVPFAGFCGEAMFEGQSRWIPFFVSTTPSKPGRSAKCAGALSAEDYSRYFQPTPGERAAQRAGRNACTADKSSCTAPFSRVARFAYPSEAEFRNGTTTTYTR